MFGIQKHTVCERASTKCGPHQRCRNFKVLPMTDAFRQAILDKHNLLRNKVALGQEKRGPQPKAANMNVLNWNDELAFIAQCWANTCQMINHDKCRRTEHLVVGQNMALRGQSWSTGLEDVELSKSFIQSWYDEVADYNPANIQYFRGTPGLGHYTEMVWAEIQYVGCAGSLYTDGGWYRFLLVCNYGGPTTGGNLLGARVYKLGEPCSQCPSGTTCNKKYKGLCGINYPVQTHNSTENRKHSSTTGYNSVSSTTSRGSIWKYVIGTNFKYIFED
ncbi:uncharacterized protein CBL_11172 [Carabus blaptoides fortunei]